MMDQFVVWNLYGVRYLALRESESSYPTSRKLEGSYYLTTICRLPN